MEISAETHPEDIVDKQPPEEDAAGADVVQVEQLHSVEGERQPKQIIGYPVL